MKPAFIQNIFIVDDDPFWTEMLKQILTELGFTTICTFASGEECMRNLELNPGLVFLDYQLNTEDGLNILQQIKEYDHRIGVIFCTSLEDLSVAVSAIKYGSFDYLLKANANKREVARIIQEMSQQQVFSDKIY